MSMFLSKLLSGRNVAKTKLELLSEAWTNIQKYYETADDPLKDAVDLTPIPNSLQNIIKLIQAEEVEFQRASGSLETGPCLEYLLQKRVLEELVEFAKVDTPFGMRIHCLRFFCSLVTNVHAQLLPERAVHVPLQKLITSSHRLISRHYEELATEMESCSEERLAAISELSLELVKLMHGIFSHFKGANAALMDLFFERGWCRSRGEHVWRCSKDGKTLHKRRESFEEKIAWSMFLMPRFDMFQYLIDFMNMPGETGEIAREAILFALRLLDNDPEYVCYIVEYSNLCEVIAERLALFFAHLPKNTGAFTISSNNRINSVRPSRRHIRFSIPAVITNNSLIITVNAQSSFKKKRRKRSPFDINFARTLESIQDRERIVDDFYSFWEYLNDVARVADKRLMTALMAQLTTSFWHPVICTALSSPSAKTATAAVAYTTEMIRSLTDQRLLYVFLVVLLGEDSGIGKDIEPEVKTNAPIMDFIDDDRDDETVSSQTTSDDDMKGSNNNFDATEGLTLRLLLINRIDSENYDLALASLRLFDTILETYNQFAVYNLVLRNYLDISPEGEYIDDETCDTTDTSSLGSKVADDKVSAVTIEGPKTDESTTGDKDSSSKKDIKTKKVRWLVERVLSLLPLEDELERMKSPPLSSVISSDSFASTVCGQNDTNINPYTVVPGNSYDDYFHEAQERFHYALLAKNFWQTPYPPIKTRSDFEREAEDRHGRPARPTNDDTSVDATTGLNTHHTATDQASVTSIVTNNTLKKPEAYEGLFLSRIFNQFQKMLELPLEQNLLITSILQKISGVVDKRTDGVICDWRAVRIGVDGTLYGGVWALPTTKGVRRSLYALLEKITFEALKRAQLVPNFETRISIAKKRGIIPGGGGIPQPQIYASHTTDHRLQTRRDSSSSSGNIIISPRTSDHTLRSHPSLSKLVFNKGSSSSLNSSSTRTASSSPAKTKSTGLLPLRISKDMGIGGGMQSPNGSSSPSATFFQNSQRPNATPVTMTNPFAKLSNFVNAYIVLQEFCKELAAVILVRHATNYNEIGFVKYQEQREMMMVDPIQGAPNTSTMQGYQQDWLLDEGIMDDDEDMNSKQRNFDKWKNRISVVSTIADWRSVRSLDTIDEAITARVPSGTKDSSEIMKHQ
ncbi:Retinoic acid induced 16-like protein-domain-containing protein [Cokeromyces recurvatus]|uniref:Retinoic acid induced 16-like protein-domain-containing protein n=1 Tax=Cokeromyces recurvatus TaxID=90255 RepID=UPI00222045F7|nr:Retinoic acid induced 16-like protein-domain-containing protein [Cokeromyces recurvatus]KAI7907351.1 Retinoic acid induced 16-like protein-domain-containing protein [Cokeromyces recurvatus]